MSLLESYENFKDAANHARMSQSALSQNISGLETIYGKSLVVRGRGTLRLTEGGKKLLLQIKPILENLQKIDQEINVADENRFIKTKISIGTFETVAINVLPRLMKKFSVLYPGIRLDLRTSRLGLLSTLVRKGELDMALTINGEADDKLQAVHLATDELGLYISPDYPLLKQNFETWDDWPMATISMGPEGMPNYYKRLVKSIPSKHHIVFNSDSYETIRSLTIEGSAVGLLPVRVAERKGADLIKIWPKDEKISKQSRHYISLITRKAANPKIVQIFKAELIDCLNNG